MSEGNGASALVPAVSTALLRPVANPAELVTAHKEATEVIAKVLEPGRDFGSVPGTSDRQVLMKAGAERLLVSFGCYATTVIIDSEADHNMAVRYRLAKWVDKPQPSKDEQARMKALGLGRNKKFGERWAWQESEVEEGEAFGVYRYVVRTDIIHRQSGQVVGSGLGSCSTAESKYIRAPRDAENTVLKMAKKRSMVDAVLSTFGLSDRFTQDIEESAPAAPEPTPEPPFKAGDWFKSIGGTKETFAEFNAEGWGERFKSAQDVGVRTVEQLRAFLTDGERPSAHEAFNPFEDDEPGKSTSSEAEPSVSNVSPQPISATNEASNGSTKPTSSTPTPEPDEDAGIASAIRPYEVSTSEGRKLRAAAKRMGKNLAVEAAKCQTKTFEALMVALDPDWKPGEKSEVAVPA